MTVVYATVTQLNAHLPAAQAVDTNDATELAEANRLLARASELVDSVVRARYAVDTADAPTDATIAAALTLAVCAQYEQWIEVGEANAIDGLAGTQIAVSGYSGGRAPAVAPRAMAALKAAGLLQPVALAESLQVEDDD